MRSVRFPAHLAPAGDYRLIGPAGVVWIVTVIGLCGPPSIIAPIAVVAAVAGLAGVAAVRLGGFSWSTMGVAIVLAGIAAMTAAALALRLHLLATHPLSTVSGKTRISATIRDDAVPLGPAQSARIRVRVDVAAVDGRTVTHVPAELTGPAQPWADLLPGQRFSVRVRVSRPRSNDLLAAQLSALSTPQLLGRPPPHQRFAGAVRHRLQVVSARALGENTSGLLPGLVLGDTSTLDQHVRDDFRAAGLSHLVAVSGSNFAVVTGAAVLLVRALGATPRVTAISGAVIVVVFVILVRPSPSVLRAAMMGMIGLVALAGSRRAQSLPALGAAVIVGLLWWPELAIAPGFVLSVVATAGLVLWAGGLRDWLRDHRIPRGLAELLAMTITAQLITAPVIAALNGRFSVVGLVANILVVPIVGVVSVVGVLAAVIGAVGGPDGAGAAIAELLLRMLAPELRWMVACARVLGRQTWATVTLPDGVSGAVIVAATITAGLLTTGVVLRWRAARAHVRRLGVAPVWHDGRRE